MEQVRSSGNQSRTWSDDAFGTTEFLLADYHDFVFPPHVHETFAIGIIETGGQQFRPGRASSLIMPAGTLCAINPDVVHEGLPATSQGWRYRMFYPSPSLVAGTLGEAQHQPRSGDWGLDRHVIDDPELYREFEVLHVSSELRETLLERETRISAFTRRLFERHGNFSPERTRARVAPRTVGIVRDYLHANAEHHVSIGDLAQAAGVSGTQVIRAFSAETGMPPHSYLVSLRVERAKALLRAGTSPAAAALHVGFSDQSQLTRHFKRITGVTPGRFAAEASLPGKRQGVERTRRHRGRFLAHLAALLSPGLRLIKRVSLNEGPEPEWRSRRVRGREIPVDSMRGVGQVGYAMRERRDELTQRGAGLCPLDPAAGRPG